MVDQRNNEAQISSEIRQSLVDTAVGFLNMNNIRTQPEEKKRQFLAKKGLSPEEIEMAFMKSNTLTQNTSSGFYDVEAQNYFPQNRQLMPLPPPFSVPYNAPRTIWTVIRDSFNMFMYISGIVVIFNYLYKYFIYPFLTGKKLKPKEEVLLEIQASVMEVVKHLESTIDKINNNILLQNEKMSEKEAKKSLEPLFIDDIKTELTTIKSLLINKKTFPSLPSLSYSIPEWQKRLKPSTEDTKEEHNDISSQFQKENYTDKETKENHSDCDQNGAMVERIENNSEEILKENAANEES